MAILRIPTSTDPELPIYRQRSTLDGREYVLRFEWNGRSESWTLHLLDADEHPIVSGMAVVPDWDLLLRVVDDRRPPGKLIAVDFTGRGKAPGLTELGRDVVLYYFDAEELSGG